MLNSRNKMRAIVLAFGASFGAIGVDTGAMAQVTTGPSSSQSPYVVPLANGVRTHSILTVGDSVNNKPDGTPYRMVGIPDGMGVYSDERGTFTVLMNQELRPDAGVVRAHGAKGAFVSKWKIRSSDLTVLKGEDLIQNVSTWNPLTTSYKAPAKGIAIGRLCSADLPAKFAFFNPLSGRGTREPLFMNGEEVGPEGRGFANALNGTTYEVPRLGKFSWENALTHPFTADRTVVVGTDDATPGQVYVYVGTKTNSGSVIDRAGLTNGQLYGIKVDGFTAESSATGIGGGSRRFSVEPLGNVENKTGAQLEAQSNAKGVMQWLRPEDGHWDRGNFNDFYFVTTNRFDSPSRMWRLRFDNFLRPELGGNVEAVINDRSAGQQMFDNMTIDTASRAIIQEDPGNQDYLARLWQFRTDTRALTPVAQHDPARFTPGAPGFLTRDEESSGVVDMKEFLGEGWFLINVQAHYPIAGELVEGGQLLAMHVPVPFDAPLLPFPGFRTPNPFPGFNLR